LLKLFLCAYYKEQNFIKQIIKQVQKFTPNVKNNSKISYH